MSAGINRLLELERSIEQGFKIPHKGPGVPKRRRRKRDVRAIETARTLNAQAFTLPTVNVNGVTYVTTDPGELVKDNHPDIRKINPMQRPKYPVFKQNFVNFLVSTRPMRTSGNSSYSSKNARPFYQVFISALEKANLPTTLWGYLITAMERENFMGVGHPTQNIFNVDVPELTEEITAQFSRIKHPGMRRWLTSAGINLTDVASFKRDMKKLGKLVSTSDADKIAKAALLLLAYTSRQLYIAFASSTSQRKDFSTKVKALNLTERAVMVFFAASGFAKFGKQVSGIVQARRLLKKLPVAVTGKFLEEEKKEVLKGLRGQYTQFVSRYKEIRQKLIDLW